MIYSEDAPSLENALHKKFNDLRLNKVNPRKEFFRVSLGDIRAATQEMGLTAQFTMLAQAQEYRESLVCGQAAQGGTGAPDARPAEQGGKSGRRIAFGQACGSDKNGGRCANTRRRGNPPRSVGSHPWPGRSCTSCRDICLERVWKLQLL